MTERAERVEHAPQPSAQPRPFSRARLLVYGSFSVVVVVGILFLAAGRLDLPMFWAYVAMFVVAAAVGLGAIDPDLARERFRPGPGGRDHLLVHVGKIGILAHLVLAGLDAGRWHVLGGVPIVVSIIALALTALGLAFSMWAMLTNRFFSSVVRLQTDRGHHLVTAGPYRFVRHPGYTGFLIAILASGPALGSWLAAAAVVPFLALILRRTLIEDRFLHEQLDGYAEYAKRVRYRLFPGIW